MFLERALTGTGQNVALFELDGYYAVDITNYVAQAGIALRAAGERGQRHPRHQWWN